ncbi:MAG: hypothetical protein ABWY56_06230 [Propionibacteriaceae bacterium]
MTSIVTSATGPATSARRSKLVAGLITLACVVLATIGLRASEDPNDFQLVDGTLGQTVVLNEGEVVVDDVQVGNALLTNGDISASTPGMFVVVSVTVSAPGRDRLLINTSELTSGDRTYKTYSSLDSISAVPGFESTGDLVYEVDPKRIDDLTIDLWNAEVVHGYYQRVRVPLGITARNADAFRARAGVPIVEPILSPTTRVIP